MVHYAWCIRIVYMHGLMTIGCYYSLATTHRVHDISPILPHVVVDSTCSHYACIFKAD